MDSPVSPPYPSPSSDSSDNSSQSYQGPALPFILVPILPVGYCVFWCLIHLVILFIKKRRGSDSASETPVLPVRNSGQPRQQQQQQLQLQVLYRENGKGVLNKDCPICLEEAEEDQAEAETKGEGDGKGKGEAEAEAEIKVEGEAEEATEEISWRVVPECCHRFHELCLNRWLKLSQTCPLCRVTTQLDPFVYMV